MPCPVPLVLPSARRCPTRRQTEGQPSKGWARMTWEEYVPWALQYISLHARIAGQLGKPLVLEEFNILITCVRMCCTAARVHARCSMRGQCSPCSALQGHAHQPPNALVCLQKSYKHQRRGGGRLHLCTQRWQRCGASAVRSLCLCTAASHGMAWRGVQALHVAAAQRFRGCGRRPAALVGGHGRAAGGRDAVELRTGRHAGQRVSPCGAMPCHAAPWPRMPG